MIDYFSSFFESLFNGLVLRPIVLMIVLALPLLIIARFKRIYPTPRLLFLVSVPAIFSLVSITVPSVIWYVGFLDLVLLLVACIDLVTTPAPEVYQARRETLHIASLGKPHLVELHVTNTSRRGYAVTMQDDLPDCFEATPSRFVTELQPKAESLFSYKFASSHRGPYQLKSLFLRVGSRLKLWQGFYGLRCESEVNVYPDMQQISQYELLARTNRLSLVGVRRRRKIGQDNEFERLRDYTQDDNHKHIDWRTTARRQKLTVKDFQSNQSQRVIFMVDCGRMMTGGSEGLTMLDHSLNAMLMLSYVALKQGDSVGLICFSDTIHNYTPPRNGVNQINRLLHASFDRQPQYVESNYDNAFLYLRRNCLKRSLVVLVTNVIDEINAHQIRQYLGAMSGHHLPVGVLLRDHEIFEPIEEYQSDPSLVYEAAAASYILSWRHQVIRDLRHSGVMALDVFPENLTSKLVNQYLEIKARSLL